MPELERGIEIISSTTSHDNTPEILLPRPNNHERTYPFGKGINLNMIVDCDGDHVPIVGIGKLSDIKREGGDYFRGFELISHIENSKGDSVTLLRDRGDDEPVDGDFCALFEDGRPGDRVYKPENQNDKNKRNWNHQKRKKF